jgi:uncharacterized protein involved in exopolysaccharide biosynthesis
LTSSELKVRQDRLERDLSVRQRLFASLSETFEQARLEEVRDTPVVTVIESPEIPAQPDRRFLLIKTVLAGAVGTVLMALWLLARIALRRLRDADPEGWTLATRPRAASASPEL